LFFELTGYKIDIEGEYEKIIDYSGNSRWFTGKVDPSHKEMLVTGLDDSRRYST